VAWPCPGCKTEVEDGFDVCWSCGTGRDGAPPDPAFAREADLGREAAPEPEGPPREGPGTERPCPDCGGPLSPVKLIESGGTHWRHTETEYAAGDAQQGLLSGRFPVEGRVRAWMCADCGRILLYGAPRPPPG